MIDCISQQMRAINWLFKKAIKVRLEGTINELMEKKLLLQLEKVNTNNAQALLLIINSYGGSLRVAKNISYALKQIQYQKIPVYCFAQEYCLNSANLILTSGTKCFASRLSTLGDFGFAKDIYTVKSKWFDLQRYPDGLKLQNLHNSNFQINDLQFIKKWLDLNTSQLQNQLMNNRGNKMFGKNLKEKIRQGSTIVPSQAVKLGFIDGIQTCQNFIEIELESIRVKQQKEYNEYRLMGFLRNTLQIFKQ